MENAMDFYFGNGFPLLSLSLYILSTSSSQVAKRSRSEESEQQQRRGNIQYRTESESHSWRNEERKYRNESFYDFPSSWLIGNFRFRLSLSLSSLPTRRSSVEILLLSTSSKDFVQSTAGGIYMCCYVWCARIFLRYCCSHLIYYHISIFFHFIISCPSYMLILLFFSPQYLHIYRLKAASLAFFLLAFLLTSFLHNFDTSTHYTKLWAISYEWFLLLCLTASSS